MSDNQNLISIKTPSQILDQSHSAEILKKLFYSLPLYLPENITELELANHAMSYLQKRGCELVMKGYKGFPADISISKNHVVAHGIPSDERLRANDIVTIDIIGKHSGFYSDMSYSYGVGTLDEEREYLLKAAWYVCKQGLQVARVGNTLYDVAEATKEAAAKYNVFIYNQFAGHGIGTNIHEPPLVHYTGKLAKRVPIVAGMVLCIEPIISLKPQKVRELRNGVYIGKKEYPTAVYEHMVGVFSHYSKVLSYNMLSPEVMPNIPPHFIMREKEKY